MGIVRFQQSISLDGYSAGPNQSEEEPLGERGEDLHEWLFKTPTWLEAHGKTGGEMNASNAVAEELESGYGAVIMGRKMFGPIGGGDWGDGSWKGWWGDNPPYHTPVYVLTHHEREPVEMEGGTTFNFVTDGIESALEQAREAAGDRDVQLAGGASTLQQYLAAGLVDEFEVTISPILLGAGERLMDNVGDLQVERIRVVEGPDATHVKYRVVK
jgi:dihydrofolate reductase